MMVNRIVKVEVEVEVMASGKTTGMRWEWWKWQLQEEPQGGGSSSSLDTCATSFTPEHTGLYAFPEGALPLTLSGR